jgi:LuxR family maltose regulon positive regulatory protein
MNMFFPAVVALINELINKYKLGEFLTVIDECSKELTMSASFKDEIQDYWNVINMPLGMCYFEMNKPNLAIKHLKTAKASIDNMRLFHMHGYVELYLFKSFYILKDTVGMEGIINEVTDNFEHMHYKKIDLLISMMRVLAVEPECYGELETDIEVLELEYMKNSEKKPTIAMEALAYLKIKGIRDIITIEDMVKCLEKLRFTGMIPYVQLFLVLLGEMHYMENKHKEAEECLKEAVKIYKEYSISGAFLSVPLKSKSLMQKIDQRLYSVMGGTIQESDTDRVNYLLSTREREIMELIALGKSNEEISKTLYIGIGTIKWHINHIFSKLEVKNRVQAIEKAKSLGEI